MKISQEPLQFGGSYSAYKLIKVSDDCLIVKPTSQHIVFMSGFIVVGLLFLVISYWNKKEIDFFGIIFLLAGLYGVSCARKTARVDKSNGFLYSPQKTKRHKRKTKLESIESAVVLSEIVSVQVLEVHASADGDYVYYEINVIKHNGERAPVFWGSDRDRILCDARIIAEFLNNIPILFHLAPNNTPESETSLPSA